jgi:hypothetical protein
MRDANGKPLRDGAAVRLLHAPPELLRGLPSEDREAIQWAANRADMRLVGRDDYGNVELEFKDFSGTRHWIFVRPSEVAAI